MLMNPPPSSVRIGPFTYSVGPMSPMEATKHGLFGWHHWPSCEIRYRNDGNAQQLAHVILHEILHGVWYVNDLEGEEGNREQEENYVRHLGVALCDLIRDNPQMIAWISQTLAGDGESFLQVVKDCPVDPKIDAAMTLNGGRTVYVNDKPTLWA